MYSLLYVNCISIKWIFLSSGYNSLQGEFMWELKEMTHKIPGMHCCSASFGLSLPQALLVNIWTESSWVSVSANKTMKFTTSSGTCGWHSCPCDLNAPMIWVPPQLRPLPPVSRLDSQKGVKSIGWRHPGWTQPHLPSSLGKHRRSGGGRYL